MFFRQYELGCLSLFSYLIGDEATGRAVVIDPQRDVSGYLGDAEAAGLHIERVIETHFHADFLSGHLEIAAATGAAVSYGPGAKADFPIAVLADGERLPLGDVVLEIRSTPGHTPESICVVVWEHAEDAEPWGVLTGDTLFIGDVGRPDLLASAGVSADELARSLYGSLHDKLLTLPDATKVFPAHGAGSACGKHMASASESTIGEQRRTNYALAPMSVEQFVAAVTEGQSAAPMYFAFAAGANRAAHELLDDQEAPPPLSYADVVAQQAAGAVVLDARSPEVFASGHLRGSVNVGIDGRFADYVGEVVAPGTTLVLVTEPGRETEAKVRLARIGFDTVAGHIPDVERLLLEHPDAAGYGARLPGADLASWRAEAPALQIVDVRMPSEQEQGVIPGARLVPLTQLTARTGELDPSAPTVIYCASGYRSSIAASVLRAAGFAQVADILGGFDGWRSAGLDTEVPAPA